MKDILTIIMRLTITCILAATVMGSAFIITNKAKKHNEHVNEQKVRYSLLGYSAAKPIPESMALHEMYRYVVTDKESQAIGYLLPGKEGFFFLCFKKNISERHGHMVPCFIESMPEGLTRISHFQTQIGE